MDAEDLRKIGDVVDQSVEGIRKDVKAVQEKQSEQLTTTAVIQAHLETATKEIEDLSKTVNRTLLPTVEVLQKAQERDDARFRELEQRVYKNGNGSKKHSSTSLRAVADEAAATALREATRTPVDLAPARAPSIPDTEPDDDKIHVSFKSSTIVQIIVGVMAALGIGGTKAAGWW